jgi:hypothetical protein
LDLLVVRNIITADVKSASEAEVISKGITVTPKSIRNRWHKKQFVSFAQVSVIYQQKTDGYQVDHGSTCHRNAPVEYFG